MKNQKNWLQYYRNSLFDSENLAVDINRIKNLFKQNNSDLSNAIINTKNAIDLVDTEERRINRLRGITKKDDSKWFKIEETEILVAPFYLEYQTDNLKYKKQHIYPFWINAKVNRRGELVPPKDGFPLIVRNYITPIADVKNDFIFSSIDAITNARDIESPIHEEEMVTWNVYWDYINTIFKEITFTPLYNYRKENYNTKYELTYFAISSKIATAKSILFLYDNIVTTDEELPLVAKIINPVNRERRLPVTNEGFLNKNHLHLGQMSNIFPLSITQRKTLLSYLTTEDNAISAVNGPPGTGKTTLLQSLVATEVVKAAIIGEDAPIILACSNNNQAVTNIIDSFINAKSTMDELAKRWIPNFNGHATYLPSNGKGEKSLANINFLKGNMFGQEGTLCDLENETYLYDAENYFLHCFNNYFKLDYYNLEDTCNYLQNEIIQIEDTLIDSVDFSIDYINSLNKINNYLLNEEDYIQPNVFKINKLQEWRTALTSLKTEENNANFIKQFSSLFYIEENSNKKKEHVFKASKEAIENTDVVKKTIKDCIATINLVLQSNLKLKNWKHQHNIKGFPFVSEEQMWNFEYEKLKDKTTAHEYFYDELDINLRHKAFLLATHYWEARWLIATINAIENNTEKGTGELAIQTKWKRRAMLTPCFVATFYTAPSHFLYSQFKGENEQGKPIFDYLPLYNFLDLLIVDEAGQVTPEVSIPMFALAKKAFVIGDLKQIEPIWTIPQKIDAGNLQSLQVTQNNEDYNYLDELGFLASSGSIMKMAQNACEYESHVGTQKEKGLILLEHRRCNDEIIGFCNELAYNGILKPMKGKAKEEQLFPSMLAYHVEGLSERKYNSRCNLKEVNSIITWLQQNKEHIQQAYNVEDIESILGIITPFASQKGELAKALSEAGYKINDMKLGTVHALQGAERNIILFSSVYSNQDEGTMFFDRDNKPNMLNVAVSRAKDSFILFGDTRIFDETQNTPSGVLKRHLNIFELN